MRVKGYLEEIEKICRTCKECDPCCPGNILKKYLEQKKKVSKAA